MSNPGPLQVATFKPGPRGLKGRERDSAEVCEAWIYSTAFETW